MIKFLLVLFLCNSTAATAQRGITWNSPMNIAAGSFGNQHPRITLDGAGNPLVIWGKMSDQSVYFTRWTGAAFTTPVKLNPGWLTVATASWMGPDIASKGDTVYVVVRQSPESVDTSKHIYIMKSFDGGITFSAPVRVDYIGESISRFPTVTVDAAGNPIVAFMKFDLAFGDARWVVTTSTDMGESFREDVKASGWGNSSAVCDCCPGAIISSGSTCAMLYRDNNSDIRDCWAGVSTSNGATFTSGFELETNNWNFESCPASGPDGVIVGDMLYSVFMNGASGVYRTYLSTASIRSAETESVMNLAGSITGLNQQNYPRIATDGNAMAVVWKQVVSGEQQLPILFTTDIANGFPPTHEIVDLGDITNADVALANGSVFVVWEDDNSGTVRFRSGTFATGTTGISGKTEKVFSVFPNPARDILNISSAAIGNFHIRIFNSLGIVVYTGSATSDLRLDTSNFPSGLYMLQLQSAEGFFTQRFIR
ncbi:MAG: T9SS type A sorting domain-containing protein [Bacteroidota bacterium]